MTFLPHATLVVLVLLWAWGVPQMETPITVVAVVLPLWVMWTQRAQSLWRAFLLGPVTLLVIATVAWIAWDADERDWLMKLLAGVVLAGYAVYCVVLFAIAAWWRRRRRKRAAP
jgi:hypothetical protein